MFKQKVAELHHALNLAESEESWDRIAKAVATLSALYEHGACNDTSEGIAAMRTYARPLVSAMNSERTRLSGTAIGLVGVVASCLGTDFEPLVPTYLPSLLALCGRTNKVVASRARASILAIIDNTQLPGILSHLLQNVHDKAASLRLMVADATLACVNSCNPPDLEKEPRARDIEAIIRASAKDSNPDVRKVGRQIFAAYKLVLPGRVDSFTAPMTPTIRKYLDIKPKLASNSSSRAQSPNRPSSSRSMNSVASVRSESGTQTKGKSSASTAARTKAPPRVDPQPKLSSSTTSRVAHTASRAEPALSKSGPARVRVERGAGPAKLMPPPEYIPVRAAPDSSKQRLQTARSMTAIRDRKGTSNDTPLSPARPPSASARLQESGPVRPIKSTALSRSTASSSASNETDRHNTAGGARRILLPDPAPVPGKDDVSKSRPAAAARQPTAALGSSMTSVPQKEPVAKVPMLKRQASRPQVAHQTGTEKPKPVSKIEDVKKASDPPRKPNLDVKGKGATQPTLAQLARMKTPIQRKVAKAGTVSVKPGWGMGAMTKKPVAAASAKVVSKAPVTTQAKANAAKSGRQAPFKPTSRVPTPALVPLPPSPTPAEDDLGGNQLGVEAAAQVQLPPSPTPREGEQEDAELLADDDAFELEEAIATESVEETPELAEIDSPDIVEEAQIIFTPGTPMADEPEYSTPQAAKSAIAVGQEKTPISALLSSIQQGFLMTPTTPLSPPSAVLARAAEGTLFMGKRGEAIDDDEVAFGLGMLGIGPNMGSLKSMGSLVRRDMERPALTDVEINHD